MKKIRTWLMIGGFLLFVKGSFQTPVATKPFVSKVGVADQGDETYKTPVLPADYSDPGVIRGW